MELSDGFCSSDHYSGGIDIHFYAEVYCKWYDKWGSQSIIFDWRMRYAGFKKRKIDFSL